MKLPDELEELKLRLNLELDSNITDRVIDEWYEEYQEDYEKLLQLEKLIASVNDSLESADPSTKKDADEKDEAYWRHWALQNIS